MNDIATRHYLALLRILLVFLLRVLKRGCFHLYIYLNELIEFCINIVSA